jgi:hypothetical protein
VSVASILLVHGSDEFVEVVDVAQVQSQHDGVIGVEPPD